VRASPPRLIAAATWSPRIQLDNEPTHSRSCWCEGNDSVLDWRATTTRWVYNSSLKFSHPYGTSRWRRWWLSSPIRHPSRGGPDSHIPGVERDDIDGDSPHWFFIHHKVDPGHHRLCSIWRLPQGLLSQVFTLSPIPWAHHPSLLPHLNIAIELGPFVLHRVNLYVDDVEISYPEL
jgi:hypothetical protein